MKPTPLFSLKMFKFLIIFLFIFKICWANETPYFENGKKLLKKTWDRPDLRVKYLRHYPEFWINDSKNKLALSIALKEIGEYHESLFLGKQLLLSSLSFWDRGKNYINIAQIYTELGLTNKARYYFDKAIIRNRQYYFYLYARFEEFEGNYPNSIKFYQHALSISEKEYICKAYIRVLHKALIHFKYRNRDLYLEYNDILMKNPHFPKAKTRVINKALIF